MADDAMAPRRSWLGFVAVVAAALALDVAGLALHPEFQPVYTLRAAAPAFTHRVAARRAEIDVPGEFNPGGRALFLGFVMVAATLIAWLLAAQAAPSLLNAVAGAPRAEAAGVVDKPAETSDADCGHRLVVTSASIARPLDACVDAALWRGAAVGSRLTIDLQASPLGAEVRGLRP